MPAEWSESVKHRNTRAWQDWLADVIDVEALDPDRRRFWFWRVHDTSAILALWARHVPAQHIHVVTVPAGGRGRAELLWDRFAGLLGVDLPPAGIDAGRANASLGVAETEFLRRFNEALPEDMTEWFYIRPDQGRPGRGHALAATLVRTSRAPARATGLGGRAVDRVRHRHRRIRVRHHR